MADVDERVALTYKDAGVDIDAQTEAIRRIKARAVAALGVNAGPIGHFGGTYRLASGPDQILVASADGVGTKVHLATLLGGGAHARVGHDIVNHCVNDILALGARPLFFLDYFGTGVLDPDVAAAVVGGVSDGCLENGMPLLGGEIAEMREMYKPGDYDLAGFIVGSVHPDDVMDGSRVETGDIVMGLPSTGLHTNGYSLARKILGLTGDRDHDQSVLRASLPGLDITLGDALMAPHRSYLADVRPLFDDGLVHGMAHITGGGLLDNLPRALPDDCIARLDTASWVVPPIFDHLIDRGNVDQNERYRVFNMGIGFALVTPQRHRDRILDALPEARQIGEIVPRMTSDETAVQGLSC